MRVRRRRRIAAQFCVPRPPLALRPDRRRRSLIVPSLFPILTVTAVEALYLPVPSLRVRWMENASREILYCLNFLHTRM